jgi:PPM family protein phosphatase
MNKVLDQEEFEFIIQAGQKVLLEDFQVEIESSICQISDVYYFQVSFYSRQAERNNSHPNLQKGLLRVGSLDGALHRELEIRDKLGDYKMLSKALFCAKSEKVFVSSQFPSSMSALDELSTELRFHDISYKLLTHIKILELSNELIELVSKKEPLQNEESEFLEEEYYQEDESLYQSIGKKILFLSDLPSTDHTLETWLKNAPYSVEEALSVCSQLCQVCNYISKHKYYFVDILPQFVQIGTSIQIFDLTRTLGEGTSLSDYIVMDYSAPEISYHPDLIVDEYLITYTIGCLLYQGIYGKIPISNSNELWDVEKIPGIFQILKICLSPNPEERFPLTQLVKILVEARKQQTIRKITWNIATKSTMGLSLNRLQNEDNFSVKQQHDCSGNSILLAVVADGMGGLAKGEVASKIVADTFTQSNIPDKFSEAIERNKWLLSLVETANIEVVKAISGDGGTTLSSIMAWNDELSLAHVGDSRIYLVRNGIVCQLSEDHSMVAMLLANGTISYEESLEHPNKNVLSKSLGSLKILRDDYIQTLDRFFANSTMTLVDKDIIIICSDGAWDLLSASELVEVFNDQNSLQQSVNAAIDKVIKKGAHDNATIVALECHIQRGC